MRIKFNPFGEKSITTYSSQLFGSTGVNTLSFQLLNHHPKRHLLLDTSIQYQMFFYLLDRHLIPDVSQGKYGGGS